MPSRADITYFGAGPALLPTPVLESASQALLNYDDTGLGLAEHSHRSPLANQILADTKSSLKALLDVPDDYEILFMQAGGSGEFSAVVYNLVGVWVERRRRRAEREISGTGEIGKEEVEQKVLERLKKEVAEELKLDYLVTGSWSLKASQEAARLLGPEHVNVATDSRVGKDGKFVSIPEEGSWKLTPTPQEGGRGSAFVYYCDNETVDGVEFPGFPKKLEPTSEVEENERLVVADMSSNILSRRVDVKKFAVIFVRHCLLTFEVGSLTTTQGGAQKNVGTTGLTLLIIRKSLLPPTTASPSPSLLRALGIPNGPIVLDYATIAKNNSLYNTLSIFDVWVAGQVMSRLLATFGDRKVSGMEELAGEKAALVYGALERWESVYRVVPEQATRSRMNICFRVNGGDVEKEKEWLKGAEAHGLMGLKGHRSVGGIRCSNYNSIPLEGVQKLAKYIESYARSVQEKA
ncbi:MAG: Phosphoserine transaminase [Thelocarpon impressellum]|nr:MAG: Phosphoserine transaminase [Thelocarpon impressellum]